MRKPFATSLGATKPSGRWQRCCSASLVAAIFVAGCGGDAPLEQGQQEIDQRNDAITGGSLAASTAPFDSIFKVPGCTATKVGPRRFLLAAHCKGLVNPGRFGATMTLDNSTSGNAPVTANITQFFIHPSYVSANYKGFDAAIVDVDRNTPGAIVPPDSSSTGPGTGLIIGGYGCDDRNPANAGKKQYESLVTLGLSQIQALNPVFGGGVTAATVDSRYLVYDGGPVSGAFVQFCPGDSGGPAFLSDGAGGWLVSGIDVYRIFGGSGTRALSVSTRVPSISGWIASPTLGAKRGTITNLLTGECLSGAGSTGSGVAKLEPCDQSTTSSGTQFWSILPSNVPGQSFVRNGKSGMCLDSSGISGSTSIKVLACSAISRQLWSISATSPSPGRIKNLATAQPLGALGRDTSGRGDLDVFDQQTGNRQMWLIVP